MPEPFKIIIADDEEDILDLLEYNLKKEGFEVIRANDGEDAVRLTLIHKPDVVILDIMMPKLNGVEACRQIRSFPDLQDISVLFLTARTEEYSELAGFEVGADDYITKPIKPLVLTRRIKATLRRNRRNETDSAGKTTLKVGNLEIKKEEYVVMKEGREIQLPRKEFELLCLLASKPGKIFKRDELLDKIWKDVYVVDRTIDVHVRKIREKIGEKYIQTIKGVGYKFMIVDDEQEGVKE